MPLSDEIKSLLLKYIAGEANEDEEALVEKWLKNDPDIFEEFEQLWDLWYAVGTATNVFRFNVDEGWNDTLYKIREKNEKKKKHRSFRKVVLWSGSIAATLLILIGFFWYQGSLGTQGQLRQKGQEALTHTVSKLKKDNNSDLASLKNIQIKTLPGKRKRIQLPDGSIVWLNGNTSIRFTMSNKNKFRMFHLSGQAFFDIQHDPDKPFVVKTEHATVKVLGTRFNMDAYPGDSMVETTLTEGSIVVTSKAGNKNIRKHIKPGQKATINYLSGHLQVLQVDTTFYTSWKEGKLIFTNESFEEVAKAMEHKYNVSISFENQSLMNKKLNGYLDKENLREALTALKLTLQFQYKINGNYVFILK